MKNLYILSSNKNLGQPIKMRFQESERKTKIIWRTRETNPTVYESNQLFQKQGIFSFFPLPTNVLVELSDIFIAVFSVI